jgi:hypothetical protein
MYWIKTDDRDESATILPFQSQLFQKPEIVIRLVVGERDQVLKSIANKKQSGKMTKVATIVFEPHMDEDIVPFNTEVREMVKKDLVQIVPACFRGFSIFYLIGIIQGEDEARKLLVDAIGEKAVHKVFDSRDGPVLLGLICRLVDDESEDAESQSDDEGEEETENEDEEEEAPPTG